MQVYLSKSTFLHWFSLQPIVHDKINAVFVLVFNFFFTKYLTIQIKSMRKYWICFCFGINRHRMEFNLFYSDLSMMWIIILYVSVIFGNIIITYMCIYIVHCIIYQISSYIFFIRLYVYVAMVLLKKWHIITIIINQCLSYLTDCIDTHVYCTMCTCSCMITSCLFSNCFLEPRRHNERSSSTLFNLVTLINMLGH